MNTTGAARPVRDLPAFDPQEELIGIFMIQILPHTGLDYGSEFRVLAYQAIAGSSRRRKLKLN